MTLFYLDRYSEAAQKLDGDIRSFEDTFEESATDERIWQAAALIRDARTGGVTAEGIASIVAGLPDLEFKDPGALRKTAYEVSPSDAGRNSPPCRVEPLASHTHPSRAEM